MTTENKNTNDDGEKQDVGGGLEQWSIGEKNTPYELNEDNTAKDPLAFRDALMRDAEKRPEIEKDKDLAVHLLGEVVGKFQECLKDIIGKIKRQQENDESFDMQSSDLMRARCTVPRDPTVLYEGMRKAGLQYGPSFRLLSQVWIPEKTHLEQCRAVDEENADPVRVAGNIEIAEPGH
ncbi:unnamed protein product [Bathycoccus prasinos]